MRRLILLFLSLFLLSFINSIKAQDCMNIGINFHETQYWSADENAFKDQMKQSGDFMGFYDDNWDNEVLELIPRDENGYPNAGIPYNIDFGGSTGVKELYVRKMISAEGRLPLENLVFLYEGTGVINFYGDVSVTSTAPGRILLTCTGTDNIYLKISQSEAAPNHLRNFRLVSVADESNYETEIWKQSFLDRLAPFNTLRFMDWNQTNGCSVWQWAQRTTMGYNCQNEKSGVAYEYIIDLCNSQNKNVWICVPHMATQDYITQMATLFRDQLHADLDIYIEYSNETWNWSFDQFAWIQDDFTWLDPSFPHNDLYDANRSIYYNAGKLADRAFALWNQAFGSESSRIKRVLACQGGNIWVAEEMIDAVGDNFDFLSPDWYFGASEQTNFSANVDAQEVIDSCRVDFYENRWVDNLAHYTLAEQLGKKVVAYEGGQHTTANGNVDFWGLQAFYDAQTDPAMYELYDDILDTLRYRGAAMVMAYTLGGSNGPYGSWGHIPNVDMEPNMNNAPKYMALIDNMPSESNCNSTPLPVEYLDEISAEIVDNMIRVYWNTIQEKDNDYFLIQRRSNSFRWENIGKVKANSNGEYEIYDKKPLAGHSFYRIQQFDKNGQSYFSDIAEVYLEEMDLELYPNPSPGFVNVVFPKTINGGRVTIMDIQGRTLLQTAITDKQITLELSNLPSGVYLLTFQKEGTLIKKKLILQR